MSKRSGVQFVQNDEPAFIRQFKEKVGYKEGPNVDTKRQRLEYQDDDEDRPETEDEKPIVVVLNGGRTTRRDLTRIRTCTSHPDELSRELCEMVIRYDLVRWPSMQSASLPTDSGAFLRRKSVKASAGEALESSGCSVTHYGRTP
ncbi:hypothetical protein BaRGS_00002935, partial [Batillaria attramentaria]